MKTVLVTGAAGFLGSYICDEAIKSNWKIVGIDNFFRGKKAYVPRASNFIFEEIDMMDFSAVEKLLEKYKPEIIVHYAAINGTEYFYEEPWKVVNHNISITMNLINALDKLNHFPEKIAYASSSEIYGEFPKSIPTNEEELVALDILATRDSYASSKAIGEFIIKNFCFQNGSEYLIFRIFNAYGPRMDTTKFGQVVPEFIRKCRDNEKFDIIGNGEHTRSFCFVKDHSRMIIELIKKASNLVVNVGDDKEIKIIDLASTIFKIMNKDFNPSFLKPRINDPLRRCPDITKLSTYVSSPNYSLEKGLNETIEWYLQKANLNIS